MLRLLRWLPLLLICLAGIGLYRGWFSFTNTSNDKDNKKVNISVSVDENKIEADAEEDEKNRSPRQRSAGALRNPSSEGWAPSVPGSGPGKSSRRTQEFMVSSAESQNIEPQNR